MSQSKLKSSFFLIIILITIIYFFNNISGVNDKLLIVNYTIILLIFIAWIMSIVRTVKEKNKIKIIPCIIITCLVITAFILNNIMFSPSFYIQLLAQIGLSIFLYELMDLFKIELNFNMINIITLFICFLLIIVFLLSQFLTINKYKTSFNNISDFLTSSDLSYEKLSTEFDSLVLDHMTFEEFMDSVDKKLFITPASYYKGMYGWAVEGLNDMSISYITNKQTFNKYRKDLNEKADWFMNSMISIEHPIKQTLISSLFITILEIIMAFIVGVKNKS